MGKGNRNSQQRMEAQLAQEEKLLAKENAKKSKKKKDRLVATACAAVALLVVAVLVLNVLSVTGVFLRGKKAMYVEGNKDVTVNGAMMTYFINDAYESAVNSFYETYYYYILMGSMEIDFSTSLATQVITSTDASYIGNTSLVGKTWYDYFMDQAMENAIDNVETYVVYANAANGIADCAIDDEQKEEIKTSIKTLKKNLKESGMTIADQYGKGVTESDIKACFELMYLASNYAEYLNDAKENEFKDKNDVLLNFTNENKKDFYSAEFLSYTISVSEKLKGSQEAFDKAVEDAKAAAAEIAKATSPEQFAEFVVAYDESLKTADTTTAETSASETETEEETETETDIEEVIDGLTETKFYETENDVDKWMFESAETYDVYVDEQTATETVTVTEGTEETEAETEEESETDSDEETTTAGTTTITYEKFEITVYMLTEKPSMDKTLTHNLAYMISDNKEAAEKFLADFLASSEKTGEKFEELAQKQYDALHGVDEHGDHNHEEGETEPIFSYSRDERAKEKYFADDYNAINEWVDNADRKAGDYTDKLIEIKIESGSGDSLTTTTYYAAVLFEGHDLEAWHSDALAGVVAEDIEKWFEEQKVNVTHNTDVIYNLISSN